MIAVATNTTALQIICSIVFSVVFVNTRIVLAIMVADTLLFGDGRYSVLFCKNLGFHLERFLRRRDAPQKCDLQVVSGHDAFAKKMMMMW